MRGILGFRGWRAAAIAFPLVLTVTGCRIGKGAHDAVSIETPMGGLNVKTDPGAVLTKIGLPAYPGSHAAPPDSDGDGKSADVDLSFAGFRLQVLAAGLETADSPAQVESFYRKALAQYSDVIACRDQRPVGAAASTGMGLTCADDKHMKTKVNGGGHAGAGSGDHDGDLELKAGSPQRQHIVSVRNRGGGTRIELVSLELPRGSGSDD